MARLAGHYIRDERLQVQDSILVLKTINLSKQIGHCIRDERLQVKNNIFLLKNNHFGKVGKTRLAVHC